MNFLMGLLIFTTSIIILSFCFLLIGGVPWRKKGHDFDPILVGSKNVTIEGFSVAFSTIVIGTSWLLAWIYFMYNGWTRFLSRVDILLFLHVAFQLISALAMIIAGFGIFREWKRHKGFFVVSMGLLLFSNFYAFALYGPVGHGNNVVMYAIGIWVLIFGGLYTSATFLIGRFIHYYDEQLPEDEKSSNI